MPLISPPTRKELLNRAISPVLLIVTLAISFGPNSLAADDAFEREPINYMTATPHDGVARLQQRLDRQEAKLTFDSRFGYLPSLLDQLNVPRSSQMLVFSKTSFQQKEISPQKPRAIYFSDDTYVGYVNGGEVLEISAIDPQLGAVFYSIRQQATPRPQFVRQTHDCLQCHASSLTDGVPGQLVRSVYPDANGFPVLSAGTFATDHTSPLRQRWGGWYVTGSSGGQPHMGNRLAPADLDRDRFAAPSDLTELKGRFDISGYLTGHSDVVALMVLEHQGKMHNLITQANYACRLAQRDADIVNRMLNQPLTYESESTQSRLKGAAEPLVRYLLFCDEAPLTAAVRGSSAFQQEFAAGAPRDRSGRSLRDLELTRRMFKYPCSYLIYSAAFEALPPPMRDQVYRRLWQILTGKDQSADFHHLSAADRRAILEILLETKQGLPEYWKAPQSPAG